MAEYNRLNWDELEDFPQAELPDNHPWPERRLFAMRIYSVALECENLAMSAGRFKPGESLERHSHGDTEEIYFLVEGKAQVMIGDEVHEARPLDAFRFPPHTERTIYNHGDEDCFWIFMGAPAHELIEYIEEVQGG